MGQCMCPSRSRRRERRNRSNDSENSISATEAQGELLRFLGLDVRCLILEALTDIRRLHNNDQELPASMVKLNLIVDNEEGWNMVVKQLVQFVPLNSPIAPAVITLFFDESPLPCKAAVTKVLNELMEESQREPQSPTWHRNMCIVIKCICEKLAGSNSIVSDSSVVNYLLSCLKPSNDPTVCLFSLLALESLASFSWFSFVLSAISSAFNRSGETRVLICNHFAEQPTNPLVNFERMNKDEDLTKRQLGFCAQWALDNIFVPEDRVFAYLQEDMSSTRALLNQNDASEYLKISADGLEARSDVSCFESVRCTFEVNNGVWYYEALIVTPGIMQIGWATKESKFFNLEGYGVGDDEYSIAYDGCRRLLWFNAASFGQLVKAWDAGDVLGCLIDVNRKEVSFYLNGVIIGRPFRSLFQVAQQGFYAAASFMTFQQCRFNFGKEPFRYPPDVSFNTFNEYGILTLEKRKILTKYDDTAKLLYGWPFNRPAFLLIFFYYFYVDVFCIPIVEWISKVGPISFFRKAKLQLLKEENIPDGSCVICYSQPGLRILEPCKHGYVCFIQRACRKLY
ncbi:SPRY domain containing protein [Trichuris trichiura]|uniref:SPRY domain containing protein n=1 Tax=Trichuris trichiura TaxID=36087 RepID=A0A077Z414_TRITR|nr:SPRY domain containing protein [Trichuris trichiura]